MLKYVFNEFRNEVLIQLYNIDYFHVHYDVNKIFLEAIANEVIKTFKRFNLYK